MDHVLRDLLKQAIKPGAVNDNCRPLERLIGYSRLTEGSVEDQRWLAAHILNCARCAGFWETLQADTHLRFWDIVAYSTNNFPNSDEGDFLRQRFEVHLRCCKACSKKLDLFDNIRNMGQRLSSWSDRISEMFFADATPAPQIYRAASGAPAESNMIDAAVLHKNDLFMLDGQGRIKVEPVEVSLAQIDKDGKICIKLSGIPLPYIKTRVTLIKGVELELGWSSIAHDRSAWLALETGKAGSPLDLDCEWLFVCLQ